MYFERDARGETLDELRGVLGRVERHGGVFRGWVEAGGGINPEWVRETGRVGRELGRVMRRGARRVWEAGREEGGRCLGGEVVGRVVRRVRAERRGERAVWQDGERGRNGKGRERRGSLERVVPECNAVGRFERIGGEDVGFVCDFCDGYLVWGNLADVPSERKVEGPEVDGYPNWAAVGRRSRVEEGEDGEKAVVFAPLVIANHVPPKHGEWTSRIICPYCEEYTYIDSADDGDGETKWPTDQEGFETVQAFQEHLQWTHTALPKPALPFAVDGKCAVM